MGLVSRVGGPECTKADGATNKLGRRKYGGGGGQRPWGLVGGADLRVAHGDRVSSCEVRPRVSTETDRQTDRQKAHPLY